MKRRLFILFILAVLVLSGCAQTHILEKNAIMSIYGVDITEQDQLRTTTVFYRFGSKGQEPASIVTGGGKSLTEGQKRMNYKLGYELQPGSIELELFGKKAAEKGLISYIESATRDPIASSRRLLAISDTTAEELIKTIDNKKSANINKALTDNIRVNNDMNTIPKATMHSFQHHYYETGRDPVLPIMTYQNKKAKLSGLALLQGDQLAGEIPVNQAFYINASKNTISGLNKEIALPLKPFKKYLEKEQANDDNSFYTALNIKEGKSQTKLINQDNLRFHTQLDFSVSVLELTERVELQQQEAIKTFEKEIEKAMKQEYTQLITKFQEENVDPIGYGRIYKTEKRDGTLTKPEWRDKFPDITVDVDVDVSIMHQGVTPK